MFLMTYLRFTSVILPLDMDSFEKICIHIFLGGKRLVWKSMGFYLVVFVSFITNCFFAYLFENFISRGIYEKTNLIALYSISKITIAIAILPPCNKTISVIALVHGSMRHLNFI